LLKKRTTETPRHREEDTTIARLSKEGSYNVLLLLSSPRVVHCFEAVAVANPAIRDEDKSTPGIEYLNREAPLSAGEDYKIRFRHI